MALIGGIRRDRHRVCMRRRLGLLGPVNLVKACSLNQTRISPVLRRAFESRVPSFLSVIVDPGSGQRRWPIRGVGNV
jgi:hypothetical protein